MSIHYLISDEGRERINNEFWRSYDTEHWFYKIKMYNALLENAENFIEEMGDEEFQEKSADSFHQAIESEIVFNFYHMTGSLFMLISVCNSLLPWVEMRHIRVNEIADFMREVVIKKDWEEGHLKQIFYPGMREPEEHEGTMESSIEFIEEYLARMSEWYLDNDIYNEYKHGMRLSTSGGRLQIAPEKEFMGEVGPVVFEREGTTHVYLEEEEVDRENSEVYHTLNRVMSGFDYELFQQLCYINYLFIDQIVNIRREQIRRTPKEGEKEQIEINSFHDMDIDKVFDYNHEKEWEFKLSYPVGESMVTIE